MGDKSALKRLLATFGVVLLMMISMLALIQPFHTGFSNGVVEEKIANDGHYYVVVDGRVYRTFLDTYASLKVGNSIFFETGRAIMGTEPYIVKVISIG